MKRAFITGITGMDGSHLAELLMRNGYMVYGLVRRSSSNSLLRIASFLGTTNCDLIWGDVTDFASLIHALEIARPDEIYNLAAQSHVKVSFGQPELTAQITGLGTLHLLEAMRQVCPKARFYQASSSEMFGKVRECPQRELTPFNARSPYGAAKIFAHETVRVYREAYGLHASCGILFNHEGPRRGEEFVTRKITMAVARIKAKKQEGLTLGNLYAKRDWGYAPDYCRAMWLMLQQEKPDDYVIGTGETHSVEEFVHLAFTHVGLDYRQFVGIDESFMRPAEVDLLQADPSKARRILGWEPLVSFKELVRIMVDADMESLERNRG